MAAEAVHVVHEALAALHDEEAAAPGERRGVLRPLALLRRHLLVDALQVGVRREAAQLVERERRLARGDLGHFRNFHGGCVECCLGCRCSLLHVGNDLLGLVHDHDFFIHLSIKTTLVGYLDSFLLKF